MTITQTVTFTCEACGKIVSKTEEVGYYDDPVIKPSNNEKWDYGDDDKLRCPECMEFYEAFHEKLSKTEVSKESEKHPVFNLSKVHILAMEMKLRKMLLFPADSDKVYIYNYQSDYQFEMFSEGHIVTIHRYAG